jgi:hypothetical protein
VQDFGIHEGRDICSKSSQLEDGYACFRASGTQYHGTPLPDRGGEASLSPMPATTRILAGYDRIVLPNLTLGVRLGWVLAGGGPRPSGAEAPAFLPFHGEARVGYTFGLRPFERAGIRGSVFLGAGVAQFDTEYRVFVEEDPAAPPPRSQLDNPPQQMLSAYRKSGTGFVSGGAAITWAASTALGISLGLRMTKTFPSSGTLVSPELSAVWQF